MDTYENPAEHTRFRTNFSTSNEQAPADKRTRQRISRTTIQKQFSDSTYQFSGVGRKSTRFQNNYVGIDATTNIPTNIPINRPPLPWQTDKYEDDNVRFLAENKRLRKDNYRVPRNFNTSTERAQKLNVFPDGTPRTGITGDIELERMQNEQFRATLGGLINGFNNLPVNIAARLAPLVTPPAIGPGPAIVPGAAPMGAYGGAHSVGMPSPAGSIGGIGSGIFRSISPASSRRSSVGSIVSGPPSPTGAGSPAGSIPSSPVRPQTGILLPSSAPDLPQALTSFGSNPREATFDDLANFATRSPLYVAPFDEKDADVDKILDELDKFRSTRPDDRQIAGVVRAIEDLFTAKGVSINATDFADRIKARPVQVADLIAAYRHKEPDDTALNVSSLRAMTDNTRSFTRDYARLLRIPEQTIRDIYANYPDPDVIVGNLLNDRRKGLGTFTDHLSKLLGVATTQPPVTGTAIAPAVIASTPLPSSTTTAAPSSTVTEAELKEAVNDFNKLRADRLKRPGKTFMASDIDKMKEIATVLNATDPILKQLKYEGDPLIFSLSIENKIASLLSNPSTASSTASIAPSTSTASTGINLSTLNTSTDPSASAPVASGSPTMFDLLLEQGDPNLFESKESDTPEQKQALQDLKSILKIRSNNKVFSSQPYYNKDDNTIIDKPTDTDLQSIANLVKVMTRRPKIANDAVNKIEGYIFPFVNQTQPIPQGAENAVFYAYSYIKLLEKLKGKNYTAQPEKKDISALWNSVRMLLNDNDPLVATRLGKIDAFVKSKADKIALATGDRV